MELFLKTLGEMANSEDPDQTAPSGAVWSGSTLFAHAILSEILVCEINVMVYNILTLLYQRSSQCQPEFLQTLNYTERQWNGFDSLKSQKKSAKHVFKGRHYIISSD